MKKIFLVLLGLFILTACNNYGGDITHFRLYYGSGLGGNTIYEFERNANEYYITYTTDSYFSDDDKKEIKKEVDKTLVDNLSDIIKKYNVYSWDGFDRINNNVLDGENFVLHVGYSDAKEINARGYMKFPNNYQEFKEEIIKLFKNIK